MFSVEAIINLDCSFPKSSMFRYDHEDRRPYPGKKVRNTEVFVGFLKM